MYPSFSTLSHLAWPGASQCVREEIKGKQLTVRRPCDGRLERICLEKTCIFVNEMVLLILMFMKKKPAPLHPALAGMYKNHCLKRKQNVLDKFVFVKSCFSTINGEAGLAQNIHQQPFWERNVWVQKNRLESEWI